MRALCGKMQDPIAQLQNELDRTIANVDLNKSRPAKLTNYDPATAKQNVYKRLASPAYYTGTAHEVFQETDSYQRRIQSVEHSQSELRSSEFSELKDFVRVEQRKPMPQESPSLDKSATVYARLSNPAHFTGSQRTKFAGSRLSEAQKRALAKKELPLTTDLSEVLTRREKFAESFKPVLRSAGFDQTEIKRKPSAAQEYHKKTDASTARDTVASGQNPVKSTPFAMTYRSDESSQRDIFYRLCYPKGYTGTRFIKFNKDFDNQTPELNEEIVSMQFEDSLRK